MKTHTIGPASEASGASPNSRQYSTRYLVEERPLQSVDVINMIVEKFVKDEDKDVPARLSSIRRFAAHRDPQDR